MKKSLIISIIVILLIGAFIYLVMGKQKSSSPSLSPEETTVLESGKAIVYKTSNCGCCRAYSKYLPKEGIKTDYLDISQEQLTKMRQNYGIPEDLASCHITVIGDYFISGHIPIEAINKLLAEKPVIAGIALAGMPSGTPGMPGPKNERWVIYAVGADGSSAEFMTI